MLARGEVVDAHPVRGVGPPALAGVPLAPVGVVQHQLVLRWVNTETLRAGLALGSGLASGSLTSPSWSARLKVPVKLNPSALVTVTWSSSASASSSASWASSSARCSAVSLGIGAPVGEDEGAMVGLGCRGGLGGGRGGFRVLVDDRQPLGDLSVDDAAPEGVDDAPEHVVDVLVHGRIIAPG